jgi:DNA-binding transcriptional ArsR family regulator
MLKRLSARAAAPVFAALGDERRLELVARLSAGPPVSITSLANNFDVSRQAVTKHLDVLARAGLVRHVRHGRERLYHFDPKHLREASDYLMAISREWDRALEKLKSFVENE